MLSSFSVCLFVLRGKYFKSGTTPTSGARLPGIVLLRLQHNQVVFLGGQTRKRHASSWVFGGII